MGRFYLRSTRKQRSSYETHKCLSRVLFEEHEEDRCLARVLFEEHEEDKELGYKQRSSYETHMFIQGFYLRATCDTFVQVMLFVLF